MYVMYFCGYFVYFLLVCVSLVTAVAKIHLWYVLGSLVPVSTLYCLLWIVFDTVHINIMVIILLGKNWYTTFFMNVDSIKFRYFKIIHTIYNSTTVASITLHNFSLCGMKHLSQYTLWFTKFTPTTVTLVMTSIVHPCKHNIWSPEIQDIHTHYYVGQWTLFWEKYFQVGACVKNHLRIYNIVFSSLYPYIFQSSY